MKKFKAIIVEDHSENAKDLNRNIEENCPAIEVVGIARSRKQAVAMINFHLPDLLFLDIKLPDGDGFQVLEEIENKGVAVIFTTGHMEFEYMKKAVDLSAVDYLFKPVSPENLAVAMERLVEHRVKKDLERQYGLLADMINYPNASPTEIIFRSDGKMYFIRPSDIIHISSVPGQAKTIVCYETGHQQTDSIHCNMLIKDMEAKLESIAYLKRTSRSDIVNRHKLRTYDRNNRTFTFRGCSHIATLGEAYEGDFFDGR